MPYPEDALAPHERLVLVLHPHWWYLAKAALCLAVSLLVGVAVVTRLGSSALGTVVGLVILGEVVWLVERLIRWACTFFVLTSSRVMSRRGVLAKHGIEIPLERINTVVFTQGIFERLLGLGDLEIESASTGGRQRFTDVTNPSRIQQEIYIQKDGNDNRRSDRLGGVIAAASPPAAAANPVAPSIADQIDELAGLRDQGHLTEAEFQAKKTELLGRL